MYPYLTERMLHQSAALAPLGELAVQHRERLDGSGYPRGLSGGAISRPARMLGAADAYASMREPRPHRPAAAARAARRQLPAPALGVSTSRDDHHQLRRPRGDLPGRRRLLHDTGARPRGRGGHGVPPIQPQEAARRDARGDAGQRAAGRSIFAVMVVRVSCLAGWALRGRGGPSPCSERPGTLIRQGAAGHGSGCQGGGDLRGVFGAADEAGLSVAELSVVVHVHRDVLAGGGDGDGDGDDPAARRGTRYLPWGAD